MIILIISIIMFVFGFIFAVFSDILRNFWQVICTAGLILLILQGIALPISYYVSKSNIEEFKAVKYSLVNARLKDESYENVMLQQKIIDMNEWLASVNYWNSTIFDIYICDDIQNLNYLK